MPISCSSTPARIGPRFQIELPAARAVLLDAAGNIEQREGTFVVSLLEIDAPAVHVDSVGRAARTSREGASGPTKPGRAPGCEAGGSQRSMFQWPSASRTKFKLGRDSETEPNSKRPASRADQRSPAVSVSARRKYSLPKCGSSETLTEWASIRAPSSRLKSNQDNIDGTPKARGEMRDQVAARGAGPQGARKPEARGEEQHAARIRTARSHFRLRHRRNQELWQKAGKKKSAASVNFMQHPRPARPRRQMENGIEEIEKP